MKIEKFTSEVETLKKFFQIYCSGKEHNNIKQQKSNLTYKNENLQFELELCDECFELLKYSFDRLQDCPFDIKPKCRTCESPCYEKEQWKKVAKVMKYAGIKQGLNKVKRFFKGE